MVKEFAARHGSVLRSLAVLVGVFASAAAVVVGAVLGMRHDAADAELRAAWKAMLSEAHPDRARARGLPTEFVEVAEAKAAAINAAFDAAMRERRTFALQGAA
jgi:hypothetical protein